MVILDIPTDEKYLIAVGSVAIRHGQLDHVLCMTIKSITGLPVKDVLKATSRQGSKELRERVRKLAKQKIGEGKALVQLDALLAEAKRVTDKRNDLMHKVFALDRRGQPLVKDDNHTWGSAPEASNLWSLADEIANATAQLNEARLSGFLYEALAQANHRRIGGDP